MYELKVAHRRVQSQRRRQVRVRPSAGACAPLFSRAVVSDRAARLQPFRLCTMAKGKSANPADSFSACSLLST
jgi:hypothetical protein